MTPKARMALFFALTILAADVTAGLNVLDGGVPETDTRPEYDVPDWLRDASERTVEGGGPQLLFVDPVTASHEPFESYYEGSKPSPGIGAERWRHEWPNWGQSTLAGPEATPWSLGNGFWQYGEGFGEDASYLGGAVSELVTPAVDLRSVRPALEPGEKPAPRLRAITECQGTTLSGTTGDCTLAPILDAQGTNAANQSDPSVALRLRHAYDFSFTASLQGNGGELNDGGRVEAAWFDDVSKTWSTWHGLAPSFTALRIGEDHLQGRTVVPDGSAGRRVDVAAGAGRGVSIQAEAADQDQDAIIDSIEDEATGATGVPINAETDNTTFAAPHMHQGLITSSRRAEGGPWEGFGASSGGLVESVFDLNPLAGHLVRLRFVTSTAESNAASGGHFGWVIDQVEVHGEGFPAISIIGLVAPGESALVDAESVVKPSIVAHNTGRQPIDVRAVFNAGGTRESEGAGRLGVGADARALIEAPDALSELEPSGVLHRLSIDLQPLSGDWSDLDAHTSLAAARYHYLEGKRPGWEVGEVTMHRLTTNRLGEEIEQRSQSMRRADEARIRVTIEGLDSKDHFIDPENDVTLRVVDATGTPRGHASLETVPGLEPDGHLRLPPTRDVAGSGGDPDPGRTLSWKWTAPAEALNLQIQVLRGNEIVHEGPKVYVDSVAPPVLDLDYQNPWSWDDQCRRLADFDGHRGVVRCESATTLVSSAIPIRAITRERGDEVIVRLTHEGAAAQGRLLAAASSEFSTISPNLAWEQLGSFDLEQSIQWTVSETAAFDLPPAWEGWVRVELQPEGPWNLDKMQVELSDGNNGFIVASPDFDVVAAPGKGTVTASSPTGLLHFSNPIDCVAASEDGDCQHVFLQHYPRQRVDSFACLPGALDLRQALAPMLRFRHWLDTDFGESAAIEVLPLHGAPVPDCGEGEGWQELVRYQGTTPGFETRSASVSLWEYAGEDVGLRLRYRQDPSTHTTERRHHGWLVEDLHVTGQPRESHDGQIFRAEEAFGNIATAPSPEYVQRIHEFAIEPPRWNSPQGPNIHQGAAGLKPGATFVTEPLNLAGMHTPALFIHHSVTVVWQIGHMQSVRSNTPVVDLQYQFQSEDGEWPLHWISGAPYDPLTLEPLPTDPGSLLPSGAAAPALIDPDTGERVGVPFSISDPNLVNSIQPIPQTRTIQKKYDALAQAFDLTPLLEGGDGQPVRFRLAMWGTRTDSEWVVDSLRIASHQHLTDASIPSVRIMSNDLATLKNFTNELPAGIDAIVSAETPFIQVDVENTGQFTVAPTVNMRGNHEDGSPFTVQPVAGAPGSSSLRLEPLAPGEKHTVLFRADLSRSPPGTHSLRAAVALNDAIDTNPTNDALDMQLMLLPFRDVTIDPTRSGITPFITAVDGKRTVTATVTNNGNVEETDLLVRAEVVRMTGLTTSEHLFDLVDQEPVKLGRRGASLNPPLTWSLEDALGPGESLEDVLVAGQKYAVKVTVEPTDKSVVRWWGSQSQRGTPLEETPNFDEAFEKLWRVREPNHCDCLLIPFFAEQVLYRTDFSPAGSTSALRDEFPATGDAHADGWTTQTIVEGSILTPNQFPDIPRWQFLASNDPRLEDIDGQATGQVFMLPTYEGRQTVEHRLVSPPLPTHVVTSQSTPILDLRWASELPADQARLEFRTKIGNEWSSWEPIDRLRSQRVALVLPPDFPSVLPSAYTLQGTAANAGDPIPGHPLPPFYWPLHGQDDGASNAFFETFDPSDPTNRDNLREQCADGTQSLGQCGTCVEGTGGRCRWSPYATAFTADQSLATDVLSGAAGSVVQAADASGLALQDIDKDDQAGFKWQGTGDDRTLFLIRDGGNRVKAGDVRLGGPLFGSVAGQREASLSLNVDAESRAGHICFVDGEGPSGIGSPDLAGPAREALYLSWDDETVAPGSVRLANPPNPWQVGSLVRSNDNDANRPCITIEHARLAYVDADEDQAFSNGEMLYVDVDGDGSLGVGDVRITGVSEWVQAFHDVLDALIASVGADNVGLFSTLKDEKMTDLPMADGVVYERRGHHLPILGLDELERKLPTYGSILLMGDGTTKPFASESPSLRRLSHGPQDAANQGPDAAALAHHEGLYAILTAAPGAGVKVIGSIGPAAATLARSGVVDGMSGIAVDTATNVPFDALQRLRCTATRISGNPPTWYLPGDEPGGEDDDLHQQPRPACTHTRDSPPRQEANEGDPHNYQYISPYDAQKLAIGDFLDAAGIEAVHSAGTRTSMSPVAGQVVVTAAGSMDASAWVAVVRQAMQTSYRGDMPPGTGAWEALPLSLGSPVGGEFRRVDGQEGFWGDLMQVRLSVRNATDAGGHGAMAVDGLSVYGTPSRTNMGVRIVSPSDGSSHHPGAPGLTTLVEVTNRGTVTSVPTSLKTSADFVEGSATPQCKLRRFAAIDQMVGSLAPGASVVLNVPLYGHVAPAPEGDCPPPHLQTGQLEFKAVLDVGSQDSDPTDNEHAIRLHVRELVDLRMGELIVDPTEMPVTGPRKVHVKVPLENHGTRANLIATVQLQVTDASPVPCANDDRAACQARPGTPRLQVLSFEVPRLQVPRGQTTHAEFEFVLEPGSYRIQATATAPYQGSPPPLTPPAQSTPALAVKRIHLAGPGAGTDGGWGFEAAEVGSIAKGFVVEGHAGGSDRWGRTFRESSTHNGRFGPDAVTQDSQCQAAGDTGCALSHGWQEAVWCPTTDLVSSDAGNCADPVPILEWRRDETPSYEPGVLPDKGLTQNGVYGMDDFGPDYLVWDPHTEIQGGGPAPLSLAPYDDPRLNLMARLDASDHTALSIEMQLARRACQFFPNIERYICTWEWDWGPYWIQQVPGNITHHGNASYEDWFPLRIDGWTSAQPDGVYHSPYDASGGGQNRPPQLYRQAPSNHFGAEGMDARWISPTSTWGTPTPPHDASASWQRMSIPIASQPGLAAYCDRVRHHDDGMAPHPETGGAYATLPGTHDPCLYAPGDGAPVARPVRFRIAMASNGGDAGASTFQVQSMSLGDHDIAIPGAAVLPVHGLLEQEPRIVPIRVENRGAVDDVVRVQWSPVAGRSGLGGDMDIALDTSSAFSDPRQELLIDLAPGAAKLVWIRLEPEIQSADVLPGSTLSMPFVVTAQSARDAAAGADVKVDARLATRPWPDLEITRLILGEHDTSPFQAAEGVRVEPTLLVRNRGHAAIGGADQPVHVFLQATQLDDDGNEISDTTEVFADDMLEIEIDRAQETAITGLPAWTPPRQGMFSITAAINRPDLLDIAAEPLPEIDLMRNQVKVLGIVGAVPFPDLRVQDAWLAPVDADGACRKEQRVERAIEGHAYCMTATVENAGTVGALAPEVSFYAQRSKHSSPPLDAIFPDDEFPAGATVQIDSGTWIARQRPGGLPWQMEVEVSTRSTMLDFGQDARTLRFDVPVDAYGIRIDGLPDASTASPGQTLSIAFTVANRGQVPATPRLSASEETGTIDVAISVQAPRLLPGERGTAFLEIVAPDRLPGQPVAVHVAGTTLEDHKVKAQASMLIDFTSSSAPQIVALPLTGETGDGELELVIDAEEALRSSAWHVASPEGSAVEIDHVFSHAASGRHIIRIPSTIASTASPGTHEVALRILHGEPPLQTSHEVVARIDVLPTARLEAEAVTANGRPVVELRNAGNIDLQANVSHAVDFGELARPTEQRVLRAGTTQEVTIEIHGADSPRSIGSTRVEWRPLDATDVQVIDVPWSVDRNPQRLAFVEVGIPQRVRADAMNLATATIRNEASEPLEAEVLLVVDGVVQSHAQQLLGAGEEHSLNMPFQGGPEGHRHDIQILVRPSGATLSPNDEAFYASGDARIEQATAARDAGGFQVPGVSVALVALAVMLALLRRRP